MAEWVDDQGAYFTADELDGAVDDYALTAPETRASASGGLASTGGLPATAPAVVVMSRLDERRYCLPWIDEAVHVGYSEFVARVVAVARGYRLMRLASECNGVGAMPSQELRRMVGGRTSVVEVTTTNDSKQDAFGRVKLLFSQGRLRLPRHPRLLSQLSSLEFEEMDSGRVRIAVPERSATMTWRWPSASRRGPPTWSQARHGPSPLPVNCQLESGGTTTRPYRDGCPAAIGAQSLHRGATTDDRRRYPARHGWMDRPGRMQGVRPCPLLSRAGRVHRTGHERLQTLPSEARLP